MNRNYKIWAVFILPFPVLFGSLFIGASERVAFHDVFSILLPGNRLADPLIRTIILDIRLPRILLVFFTGGILSVSGAALQAIFRNPLVDPYILGLSSGAAFGAALGLTTAFLPVQLAAFIFGLVAVGLSHFMARKNGQVSIISLILAGIITNGIFTALLTIVQIWSDPFKLQSIVHWIMGNFQNADWDKFTLAIFPVVAGLIILFLLRWKLNVLALGDEEAASSGLNPTRLKIWILLAATLASSAAIAVSGIIGLYGLVIPHVVRMLFGVDNQRAVLYNLLIGGSFLVLIDNISRSVAGYEIPIGVFTMLIGAPFFIWLLKKSNIGWQQ
ncbi:MAG: iron ABC transporter permease [Bacteroidales bacterium]|nr:iron ABC transporter permease [Bacteroidales bacterium]